MITKAIEIDNRQYERELEKKKSYQTVRRRHQTQKDRYEHTFMKLDMIQRKSK